MFLWKFIQKHQKTNKNSPPDKLLINNRMILSPRQIANVANNYFISKIETIQRSFIDIDEMNLCIPCNPLWHGGVLRQGNNINGAA